MMSMVVSAQFPILKRSIVDLLINKCMNIEVIPIPGNKVMKHGFDSVKRQFMSCLITVH